MPIYYAHFTEPDFLVRNFRHGNHGFGVCRSEPDSKNVMFYYPATMIKFLIDPTLLTVVPDITAHLPTICKCSRFDLQTGIQQEPHDSNSRNCCHNCKKIINLYETIQAGGEPFNYRLYHLKRLAPPVAPVPVTPAPKSLIPKDLVPKTSKGQINFTERYLKGLPFRD